MNPIYTSATGVLTGLNSFDSAAQSLSKAFQDPSQGDPAKAAVDMTTAKQAAQASADVFGASDRMLKHLLDITV